MPEIEAASASGAELKTKRHRLRLIVLLVVVAAIAAFVFYRWSAHRYRVWTDDAYAKADSATIGGRLVGTVVEVATGNDHFVKEGQLLVLLDSADYEVAVERARAVLAEDEANVRAAEVALGQTDEQTAALVQAAQAGVNAARDGEREARHKLGETENRRLAELADLNQSKRDLDRFENLYRQGAGAGRQQDQARTAMKKSRAQVDAADSQIAALKASVAAAAQAVGKAEAQLQAIKSDRHNVQIQLHKLEALKAKRDKSKADLDSAMLNLSYCAIRAPLSGYVAQKSVQVGDRVQPGQALMAVTPLQDIYVEANFKETQLTNVRIGQPATIKADIYPGFIYTGKVAGIRAGTGAAFSLLPSENATGNWIKVVQRVPVKIELDNPPPPNHPLRLGLSLEVSLDASDRTGPMLAGEWVAPAFSSIQKP